MIEISLKLNPELATATEEILSHLSAFVILEKIIMLTWIFNTDIKNFTIY